MLHKWKLILKNWINCYFENAGDEEQVLNIESLITIISHLRENFSHDESKSSILEAHTVEEFLQEKYPDFKFINGTVEASNEEEVCLSASLLLFFVCVNSKNMDIKTAMCRNLESEDQEIILKFSKYLMAVPVISVGEVQAAITEACGQDMAAIEPRQYTVAETPPAMRSMHGNIRRLQAELDAERFDKNYLQDELARTNAKLDRLLKDKEQHKLEILNLKAKISLCCGDKGSSMNSDDNIEASNKATKQLQQLEVKLEETLTQLHDVQYERDTLKTKIEQLKVDRDKWLELSQQESSRVSQLAEELETEKRHNNSLKELVAELRQHNRLNRFETSSLECDDPDASIHSLLHNSSICSEACANVVEVQLGEERAKIVVLQQQIQMLQVQINEINQQREAEKTTLQSAIVQRDNDICGLKHRINEQIEKTNSMKSHCDNEITKLNNDINELEQKLKETQEHSRVVVEKKTEEIQTLQEEKLSLIHDMTRLNEETTKLEKVLKELQHELDTEKQTRLKMKESYENQLMKLNEKVLNRNNELVELQNTIFNKAEEIETLQIDIRNEKEALSKLVTQYNTLDDQRNTLQNELRKERQVIEIITKENQNLNELKNALELEIAEVKFSYGELLIRHQKLSEEKDVIEKALAREEEKSKALADKYDAVREIYQELKTEYDKHLTLSNELKNVHQDLEKSYNAIQMQLTDKITDLNDLKIKYDEICIHNMDLENELKDLKCNVVDLTNKTRDLETENMNKITEINKLQSSYDKLTHDYQNIETQKNTIECELKKDKVALQDLLHDYQILVEHKDSIENDLKIKCEEEENLKHDLETKVHSLKEKLTESEVLTEKLRSSYECQIENLNVMVTKLSNYSKEKTSEAEAFKASLHVLQQTVDENNKVIKQLEKDLVNEKNNIEKLTSDFESERQVLKNMVTVTESVMEDTKQVLNNEIAELLRSKTDLESEKNELTKSLNIFKLKCDGLEMANESLLALIKLEKQVKADVENESKIAREYIDEVIKQLHLERKNSASVIHQLEQQIQTLTQDQHKLNEALDEMQILHNNLMAANQDSEKKIISLGEHIRTLTKENSHLEQTLQETVKNLSVAQIEVKELKDVIVSLTDVNNNMKLKDSENVAKLEEMKNTLNKLEIELNHNEEKLKSLLQEKLQAEDTIINLNDRLTKALADKLALEDDLQTKMQSLLTADMEIKDLKDQIRNLTDENSNIKLKEHEIITKLQATESVVVKLEKELNVNEDKIKALLDEKLQSENALTILNDDLIKSLEDKSAIENNLQVQLQNLTLAQTEIEDLKNQIVNLTDENSNITLKEHEMITKLEDTENTVVKLKKEIHDNEEKIKALLDEKLQSENTLTKLTDDLAKTLEDKFATENNLQKQLQNLTSAQTEINELKSQIVVLTDENNNLNLGKNECHDKIIELQNVISKLDQDFKNSSIIHLQEKDKLENELSVLQEKLSAILDAKNSIENILLETTEKVSAVEMINKELQIKVNSLTDENNNLILERDESLSKLREIEVKELVLRKDLDEAQCRINKLTIDLNEAEKELENRQNQVSKLQEENNLCKIAFDEVKNELMNIKSDYIDLNNFVNDLKQEKENDSLKIDELQVKLQDLEKVHNDNEELSSKITLVEKALQTTSITLQTTMQEKSKLESDIQKLTEQLETVTNMNSKLEKLVEEKSVQELTHTEMITKLTNYLKDKTSELEVVRKEKEILQTTVADNCKVIKTLEDNINAEKINVDKLKSDFESERQALKNMVSATESVMEDTKLALNNEISQITIAKNTLEIEKKQLLSCIQDLEYKHKDVEMANHSLMSLLRLERDCKKDVEKESELVRDYLDEVIGYLNKERNTNISVISALEFQEKTLAGDFEKIKNDLEVVQTANKDMKTALHKVEKELQTKQDELDKIREEKADVVNKLQETIESKTHLEQVIHEKTQNINVSQIEIKELKNKLAELLSVKKGLEIEKRENDAKLEEYKTIIDANNVKEKEELAKLKEENQQLLSTLEENKNVITNLEQLIQHELEENQKLRNELEQEQLVLSNKCSILQVNQDNAEKVLADRQKEIEALKKENQALQSKVEMSEQESKAKDGIISKMSKEKDAVINTVSKELIEEKALREKLEKELESQKVLINELKNNTELKALKKENEQLIRAIGQQETFTALSQEKAADRFAWYQEHREQVDTTSSDTHSSIESLKTISDLEKIVHDKNRTITTLQTEITYLKTLMAESENKLMDVTKELQISKDNVQQLSNQLKKIVQQKNEEISDLKKQVNKMSATENGATQIIKVSARYQAMILKRIAEIKSNTVLKELQNYGNTENELRRSLNAGSVTMEDLENFLDTTDRHLKRCAEKQISLQKERDRLVEVNKINESEIINLKKFLTELSVSFQTFNTVKELYTQKLSRVVSLQRTVRREILSLDERISDATMCKLERGYGAAMQDLAECTMNLERWVERCISRTVSVEKIKQAFTSDSDCAQASPSFQNTGLEIQLDELEKSFEKLLEEIARAVKNQGRGETQAATVMEVRAEYEDKLNRMKAKMKELFNEQMTILKNKQREEIELLQRELQKTTIRMEDQKRSYEAHIKDLTKELWAVGEKCLVKNDEAEYWRRKQRSGSLMSLQHVHSSGLASHQEMPSRPSDAHSLRSLPVNDNHSKNKRDGRGLHMSDEEGEVFDNRCLKELSVTPRHDAGQRLSELKWRNSLCPPHLKSSYPAETQFAATLDEDDLKAGLTAGAGARSQRKEVGITAYKKPGPPTPSKQAGRLSATDSELRESLRVESDPHAHAQRKTSTPSRLREFLRLNKHDSNDGTPRARRLSLFKRK